jgi:hypothetical protein
MRIQITAFVVAATLSVTACGPRRPAYNDINTNQPAKAEPQSPAATNAPEPAAGATAGQPSPPAPASSAAFKMPPFMDVAKGYPKDLPNYPQAATMNVMYGPQQDADVFSIAMQTRDPMDKIVAFYDQVIKSNGWKVSNRLADPEYSEWVLKKSDTDEAKVTVQLDKQSGKGFVIVVARTGKSSPKAEPAASKPQP